MYQIRSIHTSSFSFPCIIPYGFSSDVINWVDAIDDEEPWGRNREVSQDALICLRFPPYITWKFMWDSPSRYNVDTCFTVIFRQQLDDDMRDSQLIVTLLSHAFLPVAKPPFLPRIYFLQRDFQDIVWSSISAVAPIRYIDEFLKNWDRLWEYVRRFWGFAFSKYKLQEVQM